MNEREGEEKCNLKFKNVSLFAVERFCLLIQVKRILLFHELFFLLFSVYM